MSDIVARAERIAELIEGHDEASFLSNQTLQDAVQYSLLVLGEACKRLSPEFRLQHASVDWSEVAGMRDFLIHSYHRVSLRRVWLTCEDDIPQLLAYVRPLLPDQEG